MDVIKPINLDVSTLTIESDLDDDLYIDKYGTVTSSVTAWTSGGTFTLGQLCYYTNKKVYQSVWATGNTGHNPVTGNIDLATGLPYWVEVGVLNKYSAFDTTSNTQSIATSQTMYFKFLPLRSYSALAFTNLDVETITVSLVDPNDETSIFWTETKDSATRTFEDWYEFAFNPFSSSKNMLFDNIPPFSGAKTVINISQSGGFIPKVGGIVVGELFNIGNLTYGTSRPQLNYSAIVTDEFGNTTLTKRPSKGAIDGVLQCNANQANTILDLQDALNATPTVWVGLNEEIQTYYNSLFILGVYTQFEPSFDRFDSFRVKLYVKEL
jgi:hypothetical protein